MYVKVTNGVPQFLTVTKGLFYALQKNIPLKDKLSRDFNFNDQSHAECYDLHEQAQNAQNAYDSATTNLAEIKTTFEKRHEEAIAIFRKHSDHLKVALRYLPQKQLELGLIGREEEKNICDWMDNTLKLYNQLLADQETIARMTIYNLQRQDFEVGKTALVDSLNAYLALTNDRPELKAIINFRDEWIGKLIDKVSEIQALLLQVFENDLQQLKKLNLPIVEDEIGREMSISMVKDSSITGMINGNHGDKEKKKTI